MIRLNNKGQSLVLFVVIMPIILLMFVLVYDIGNAMYEKNKLSNVSYMVVDNIDKVDENDLIDLIDKNTNNLSSMSVLIDNGKVNVTLTKTIKGTFGKIFNFDLIEAKSEYTGYMDNGNKRIEKVG